jgi:hypothetical protein
LRDGCGIGDVQNRYYLELQPRPPHGEIAEQIGGAVSLDHGEAAGSVADASSPGFVEDRRQLT